MASATATAKRCESLPDSHRHKDVQVDLREQCILLAKSPSSGHEQESQEADDDPEVLDEEPLGIGYSWQSGEYEPLQLDYEALKHVATYYMPGNHGKRTDIQTLERGSFHEIRVLEFEDGWSCIGRLTRNRRERLSVTESECGTAKFVREHTNIPVPETYYTSFDPTQPVGAQFVLMERIRGIHLYAIWSKLSTDQKLAVIEQIAEVLAQLASLEFDKIGSIDANGNVGPLQSRAIPNEEAGRGPFSTAEEFLHSFVQESNARSAEIKALFADIRAALHDDIEEQGEDAVYKPPFRLIHGDDFYAQNMLFTWTDRFQPPKLSGVIDWDYSYTGPLYYLCEYPIFIQDVSSPRGRPLFAENKVLRKHFVHSLAQKFLKGSDEREDVRESFRQKNFMWNAYRSIFMLQEWKDPEEELSCVKSYADGIKGIGDGLYSYGGKLTWEPDSEIEDER